MCPINTTENGAKTNFSATFRTSKKSDETPIFVAFRKFFKFPGSLSALPGLLISSLGVRKRAPYHPTTIYIYIETTKLQTRIFWEIDNSFLVDAWNRKDWMANPNNFSICLVCSWGERSNWNHHVKRDDSISPCLMAWSERIEVQTRFFEKCWQRFPWLTPKVDKIEAGSTIFEKQLAALPLVWYRK